MGKNWEKKREKPLLRGGPDFFLEGRKRQRMCIDYKLSMVTIKTSTPFPDRRAGF